MIRTPHLSAARSPRPASWSALLAATALAACTTVGEDYEAPVRALPESFRAPADSGLDSSAAQSAQWWTRFADPVLDQLIERATRGNLDLRESYARLAEARALRGVSAAERFPTLDAKGSYVRRGESDNTPFGSFVPDNGTFTVGVDAAWEVDLWGRVRRSVEAADASLEASLEDVRAVGLSVCAEVALNYVELRSFQRRLEIAQSNVSLQEQTLQLVQGRFEAGLVGEHDVAQAMTNVESTRSRLPSLEVGLRSAENRLARLAGEAPGAPQAPGGPGAAGSASVALLLAAARPIPVPPLRFAVGVPADLLRRRADVRRAERQLAAEHARIGVSEGELYPRLAISGELGLASDTFSKWFESDSTLFGIGPSLRWNVFDAGRLKHRVAAQEARTEQARLRWERAVLVAVEETENALVGFVREQTRRSSLLRAADQARRAVGLARAQYREGLSDFQSVLTSERAVADLEDELASSDAAIASQFVVLYKALGGGWEPAPEPGTAALPDPAPAPRQ
ncbi:MAG: efflux transporter outer membrane subunit [Planctomycetes bacterium]|nr:efflux transporter outer membrane subunit [Planctomycetota bacterium]